MSQKFHCPSQKCNAVFPNEKSLEAHRQGRHSLELSISYDESPRAATGSIVISDQTPTPSKFLPDGENNSLFPDLPNPFDEAFRQASVSGIIGDSSDDVRIPSTAEIMNGINTPTLPRVDPALIRRMAEDVSETTAIENDDEGDLPKSEVNKLDTDIGGPQSVQSIASDKSFVSGPASIEMASPDVISDLSSVETTGDQLQKTQYLEQASSPNPEPTNLPVGIITPTLIPIVKDGKTEYHVIMPDKTLVPVNIATAQPDNKRTISETAKQRLKARLGENAMQGNMRQLAEAASLARSREERKRSTEEPAAEDTPEEKRRKFLEKNRLAASRSRAKRREWAEAMKLKNKQLSDSLAKVQEQLVSLREENMQLKASLLLHKDCAVTRAQLHKTSTNKPVTVDLIKPEPHPLLTPEQLMQVAASSKEPQGTSITPVRPLKPKEPVHITPQATTPAIVQLDLQTVLLLQAAMQKSNS